MGYGLSRISPITFDDDAFQTPNNRAKDRAPTSTPRKKKIEANNGSTLTTWIPQQDGNDKSYNPNLLVPGTGSNEPAGSFVPSQPNNTSSPSQETDSSNTTMVYYVKKGMSRTSVLVYKCHPGTPYPWELPLPLKQQIRRLYRLREHKLHYPHSPGSLHQEGRHKCSPHKMNNAHNWARINWITIRNLNLLVLQQVRQEDKEIDH